MQEQFIQFTARHKEEPEKTLYMIRPIRIINGISPSSCYPGHAVVIADDGEYEVIETVEYFQNLLKPLGWGQK